ncbi:hypothetical protein G9A89_010412 [Geosiphon pyriformis]|nr:hypothetical protein G9A89_010412 [Geosiphon pyriformis]
MIDPGRVVATAPDIRRVTDLETLKFLADMAYYAHQTYCLLDESGFVEEDIHVWVSPAPRDIYVKGNGENAIIIQVRGRELTYNRMVEWDRSRAFKTLRREGLRSWEDFKVPLESYEIYEKRLKGRIWELLEKYMSNKSYKNYSFLFTGHGEGGALATYAALDFWENNRDEIGSSQIKVTTFGAPRIGDEPFVNSISQYFEINRITYIDDFVPLFLGPTFRHPNTEYWITADMCECNSSANKAQQYPTIYNCHMSVGTEYPHCNLLFQPADSDLESHNGPYFGYRMKQCRSKYTNYLYRV